MRRHYRNHTIPGSKAADLRRRRRRVPPSSLMNSSTHTNRHMLASSMYSPTLSSSRSDSEDSDEEIPTPMDECDEICSDVEGAPEFSKHPTFDRASQCYSQSHVRTLRYGSASGSPSPSLSPSPAPDHVYTPSAPYMRSFMDPRVSTALRPVFHPAFPVPLSHDIKEER